MHSCKVDAWSPHFVMLKVYFNSINLVKAFLSIDFKSFHGVVLWEVGITGWFIGVRVWITVAPFPLYTILPSSHRTILYQSILLDTGYFSSCYIWVS